ncbi:MAG TPA: hypothetical protein VKB50_13480 [Vicinamibacterales bacterium]|nr:hypothetical protein [Vicinamibacterales bacterium]
MDARALLEDVAATYRRLRSLSVEALSRTESGDTNAGSANHHKVQFVFHAPNRFRSQRLGAPGDLQVGDGERLHQTFGGGFPGHTPRYAANPLPQLVHRPHVFRWDVPFGNGESFLFHYIAEHVDRAEFVRDEDGCHVISVAYEPPPFPHVMSGGPVLFWIRNADQIVMRQRGEVGHRFPASDEVRWQRHDVTVQQIEVNGPIDSEMFVFAPPAGASELPGGGGHITMGGGSGFMREEKGATGRIEHRDSHEWDGDTLVQRSRWRMRGLDLDFERRLTFSPDESELRVVERVRGPHEEKETATTIRMR